MQVKQHQDAILRILCNIWDESYGTFQIWKHTDTYIGFGFDYEAPDSVSEASKQVDKCIAIESLKPYVEAHDLAIDEVCWSINGFAFGILPKPKGEPMTEPIHCTSCKGEIVWFSTPILPKCGYWVRADGKAMRHPCHPPEGVNPPDYRGPTSKHQLVDGKWVNLMSPDPAPPACATPIQPKTERQTMILTQRIIDKQVNQYLTIEQHRNSPNPVGISITSMGVASLQDVELRLELALDRIRDVAAKLREAEELIELNQMEGPF